MELHARSARVCSSLPPTCHLEIHLAVEMHRMGAASPLVLRD
uniref:Uncharacterized protein n=1 Tax=Anguilla anguilla TaxID=7936 RepID=A0A0E9RJP1_ANGAN